MAFENYPYGDCKTTTLVAGLRMTGMIAPMVLDGPINGDWFEAYVSQVLVPELRPGDVVIMDNLSSPKRDSVRAAIEAVRRPADLPAALQPRLQPDREGLLPPQGHAPKGRRADRVRAVDAYRKARRHLQVAGMRKLFQSLRI